MSIKLLLIILILSSFISGCQKPREITYDTEMPHGELTAEQIWEECLKYVECDKLYRVEPATPQYCCDTAKRIVLQVRYGELN